MIMNMPENNLESLHVPDAGEAAESKKAERLTPEQNLERENAELTVRVEQSEGLSNALEHHLVDQNSSAALEKVGIKPGLDPSMVSYLKELGPEESLRRIRALGPKGAETVAQCIREGNFPKLMHFMELSSTQNAFDARAALATVSDDEKTREAAGKIMVGETKRIYELADRHLPQESEDAEKMRKMLDMLGISDVPEEAPGTVRELPHAEPDIIDLTEDAVMEVNDETVYSPEEYARLSESDQREIALAEASLESVENALLHRPLAVVSALETFSKIRLNHLTNKGLSPQRAIKDFAVRMENLQREAPVVEIHARLEHMQQSLDTQDVAGAKMWHDQALQKLAAFESKISVHDTRTLRSDLEKMSQKIAAAA